MSFSWTDPTLTITTSLMEMRFKRGAVIYLKDIATAEVFTNTDTTTPPLPELYLDFWGGTARSIPALGYASEWVPGTHSADITPELVEAGHYRITYINCLSGGVETTGAILVYDFYEDAVTGEVSITVTGTMPVAFNTSYSELPSTINIPILGFGYAGSSVIVQSEEIAYIDADKSLSVGGGVYGSAPGVSDAIDSIPLVIGKGTSSCFAAWTENDKIIKEYTPVFHNQNSYTNISLSAGRDPKVIVTDWAESPADYKIIGGPWRFTIKATWLDVVRRWQEVFNDTYTDNKPLWEKAPSWTRSIHCRYSQGHGSNYDSETEGFPAVISAVGGDKNKVLIDPYGVDYNGNGDSMIIWGQLTPRCTFAWPTAAEAAYTISQGLRTFGYWYYFAETTTDTQAANFLTFRGGGVPVGYTYPDDFVPDWSGYDPELTAQQNADNWNAYWTESVPMSGANPHQSTLHPASTQFATQLQIFRDWCSTYGLSGCFWDVSFMDIDADFAGQSFRVIDGKDFMGGAVAAAKTINDEGLYGIMPELFRREVIPYIFFVWEGPRTWVYDRIALSETPITINHPIRAALMASYVWSLDAKMVNPARNIDNYSHEYFAYMGCIPQVALSTDFLAPTFGNEYYTARAKMFCDYDMFYDLPDSWGDITTNLAYFRTNSTAMFKFVKRATGRYAYVNADNDAYILQHELKTGESTGHKTFSDTYNSTPTVVVSGGTATNVTLTGFDYTVSGTGSWLVFGEQLAPTYSRGDYLSLPTDAANLETPYTASDVANVATNDDTTYVSQTGSSQYAIHEFKNDATGKGSCTVTWDGKSTLDNTEDYPTILEIYNTHTLSWEELVRDTSTLANTDFQLSFPILSGLDNYKDENGFITCRVYQSGISR